MKLAFLAAVAVIISGCAADPKLTQEAPATSATLARYAVIHALVDAPPEVMEKSDYVTISGRLLRSFVDDLSALGKTVTTSKPAADKVLEARLTITDFNSVSTAARVLVGVLAGQAKLDVTMTLKDAANGSVVAVVSSTDSSSLLHGVFGADSDRQIEATAKHLAGKLEEVGTAAGARLANAGAPAAASASAPVKVEWDDVRALLQPAPKLAPPLAASTPEAGNAAPLSPSQFFEKASPSVLGVRALDAENRLLATGSAVIVGPKRAATTCHLLARARVVELHRGGDKYRAVLEHADLERDVCVLSVDERLASAPPPAATGGVKVGQRAYAISFAERLGLGLDEGLVTGAQSADPALPPLRVAMPLAAGASGAGVFDELGRLVGIVTMNAPRDGLGPNVNFVLPSQWIAEAPARANRQLALAAERAAKTAAAAEAKSATGAVLAPGMLWTYTFRDRVFSGRDRVFSIRATAVDESGVTETVFSGSDEQTFVTKLKDIGFQARRISGDNIVELAPYLLARVANPALPLPQTPRGYPLADANSEDWIVRVLQVRREQVTVPAGRFDAYRVTISGENPQIAFAFTSGASSAGNDYRAMRFEYEAWYAPDVGRYVQVRHKTYGRQGKELGDEWLQLTKFQAGAAPSAK